MKLILVMDNDCAIGRDGRLLTRLPDDMKRFREITQGSVVIMGRKTYESFPKRPLPNRENLVLSRSAKAIDGAEVFTDIESVLERVRGAGQKPVFVIGGAEIYRQFEQYCDEALITRVYENFGGDTFFIDIERSKDWELAEASIVLETNCHKIRFFRYIKKRVI
ncbi:MAG: dihydrofolate reductase [Oscillospiraceae bacterium]|nr:dihydrofolate reductase [Oscillospiraceae bacterium]